MANCGAAELARQILERQARDLAKRLRADTALLLSASAYFPSDALIDVLLHQVFLRACFGDAPPPRTQAAFEAVVDSSRERLYAELDSVSDSARHWFADARDIRRLLDDPRSRSHRAVAEETAEHLRQLFRAEKFQQGAQEWLRQLPRYLKAEEHRWQRLLTRGHEPPHILEELDAWSARVRTLQAQVAAERRWLPHLEELQAWLEEYRISVYAQEVRTLGPVSAARLEARAAAVETWLTR